MRCEQITANKYLNAAFTMSMWIILVLLGVAMGKRLQLQICPEELFSSSSIRWLSMSNREWIDSEQKRIPSRVQSDEEFNWNSKIYFLLLSLLIETGKPLIFQLCLFSTVWHYFDKKSLDFEWSSKGLTIPTTLSTQVTFKR